MKGGLFRWIKGEWPEIAGEEGKIRGKNKRKWDKRGANGGLTGNKRGIRGEQEGNTKGKGNTGRKGYGKQDECADNESADGESADGDVSAALVAVCD